MIDKIGIVGTGTMATGIAQTAAHAGLEVRLHGRSTDSLNRSRKQVEKALSRMVSKEKISQSDSEATVSRIQFTETLEDLKGCQLVIESIVEDLDVKLPLFESLSAILGDSAILATNTSSLSVTRLAAAVQRPEAFVGIHFFNPVPMMSLVEVVHGLQTSEETVKAMHILAEALGKTPIDVKDSPGFVVNRVLFPMINEAAFALQEGVADVEGIDACMRGGCNHPMGPLALADLVGLDVVCAILKSLHEEYGNPRYAPCLEIVKRVESGWLGRKTGQGFYDYSA